MGENVLLYNKQIYPSTLDLLFLKDWLYTDLKFEVNSYQCTDKKFELR